MRIARAHFWMMQKTLYLAEPNVFSQPYTRVAALSNRATGKKLDMGKSCVRFRALDDLALDVISRNIAGSTPDQFIARYESVPRRHK
jgi:hypothetical protein